MESAVDQSVTPITNTLATDFGSTTSSKKVFDSILQSKKASRVYFASGYLAPDTLDVNLAVNAFIASTCSYASRFKSESSASKSWALLICNARPPPKSMLIAGPDSSDCFSPRGLLIPVNIGVAWGGGRNPNGVSRPSWKLPIGDPLKEKTASLGRGSRTVAGVAAVLLLPRI